jgi:helix-turn-helix protein
MKTVSHETKRKKYNRRGNGALLNTKELANALGESVRTIISWRHNHTIPVLDLGHRSKRYRLDDVLAALQRREVKVK